MGLVVEWSASSVLWHTNLRWYLVRPWHIVREVDIHKLDSTRITKNGVLHCASGPARKWPSDSVSENSWWLHGTRHRYYGYALLREWWIHGKMIWWDYK